jgi:hypothetical protein
MSNHCFIPVLGKRIRVTMLDACGRVPAPDDEDAWLATDGFISVTLGSEVEDGTEITTKKADGSLCVSQKSSSSFKRFTVEMEFCGVNPALLSMVSNAEPYHDGASTPNVIGFTVPEGPLNKNFALELWTGLAGGGACEEGAEEASGYILLPYVQAGVLGNIEINGENAVTFSLTGSSTKGGNTWGKGPFDVVLKPGSGQGQAATPDVLPTALDPMDHLLIIETGVAPPPSACDPQPMPAAAAGG